MSTPEDEPFYSGLPMALEELSPEADLPYPLPDGARVVTIEEARTSLPEAQNVLMVLQAMSDEAHDLTNELELLLDGYSMTHPHVLEVAEHLGRLVSQWQANVARLEGIGVPVLCPWTPDDWSGTVWSIIAWPCFLGPSVRPTSSGITAWRKGFPPVNPS